MGNASGMISYREELKRKAVHLSSLWMVAAVMFLSETAALTVFGVLAVFVFVAEALYLRGVMPVKRLYDVLFGAMLREEQKHGIFLVSRGFHVLAAAFLCVLLYRREAAAAGMAVMLLGDTAAALAGRRFGRHIIYGKKSAEGVLAFLIAGMVGALPVLWYFAVPPVVYGYCAAGVAAGAAAELFEDKLHVDDNFSIALTCGAFIELGMRFSQAAA